MIHEYAATTGQAIDATEVAQTPAHEAVVLLPLAQLAESQHNPRRSFDAGDLEELADSIASQGVLQPIVVRPRDGYNPSTGEHTTHEIVFGHRRYRAAHGAGLSQIPAIIRDMDDRAARIAQQVENLQRQDVHYLEEGLSLAALIAGGMSADRIANEIGKSRSYVYGRAKLSALTDPVREAAQTGGLPAEIALMIARVPAPLQSKALTRVGSGTPVEWASVRAAKAALAAFSMPLHAAKWRLADATLLDRTGHPAPACNACPNNSINDRSLTDIDDPRCLDTTCWVRKDRAHADSVAPKPPRPPAGSLFDAAGHSDDAPPPATASVSTPSTAAHAPEGVGPALADTGAGSDDGVDPLTDLERAVLTGSALLAALRESIWRAVISRPRTRADMLYLLAGGICGHGINLDEEDWIPYIDDGMHDGQTHEQRLERIETLWSTDQLGQLMMIRAIEDEDGLRPQPFVSVGDVIRARRFAARRIALAARWGVDLDALSAAVAQGDDQTDKPATPADREVQP